MYRIGIISSNIKQDRASQELLLAANRLARGEVIDPIEFRMRINGKPFLLVGDRPAETFDAFIARGFNQNGETNYQFEILELLEHMGKLVINSTAGLSIAESKAETTFLLQAAGLPVPRTEVTQNQEEADKVCQSFGTSIIKPLYGSNGMDMEKIAPDTDRKTLHDFFRKHRAAFIQEYIPNKGRDIRVFVVGDESPAAIYRIARPGEWKTNVSRGASSMPCELSSQIKEICLESARVVGLDYTGVDVMEAPQGPVILELNGAPWWHGLREATGCNAALHIINHVIHILDSNGFARKPLKLMSGNFRYFDALDWVA